MNITPRVQPQNFSSMDCFVWFQGRYNLLWFDILFHLMGYFKSYSQGAPDIKKGFRLGDSILRLLSQSIMKQLLSLNDFLHNSTPFSPHLPNGGTDGEN